MMTVPEDQAGGVRVPTCLIHAGAIGDFILALRVVASLRHHVQITTPGASVRVEVLGNAATASLAVGRGGVDAAASQDVVKLHAMFAEHGPVDASCAEYFARFNIIVNMYASEDSTFTRRLRQTTRAEIVTIDVKPRSQTQHVTDGWLDHLRQAGMAVSIAPPSLSFTNEEREQGRRRLNQLTETCEAPIVLIHPGSSGRDKCWPIERFIAVAEDMTGRGIRAAWMLGPVELEQYDSKVMTRLSSAAPVLSECDLVSAATAIASADAYLGNDSGMTHIAAAVGTPTVAVFGPTDPIVWRPLGDRATVVAGDRPGSFDGVTVDRVCHALLARLRT